MPYIPPLYTDFFYEPLTEDVEELLSRIQRTDSVRYGVFSAIWRDMRFSEIFLGITSNSEMKRFCKVALATAVKYFLPPYSYQIRVGGLYLMFAFYHTQPASIAAKIRLALKDWGPVQRFLTESEEAEHFDVVYIYRKLVATGAIHYTAMPHLLTFQKQQQKPNIGGQCGEFLSPTTALQELHSADILEEMASIHSHYEKLKEATVDVNLKVNMTQADFTSHLNKCMSEFFTWRQRGLDTEKSAEGEVNEAPEDDCSSRARLLSSIKQKSYSSVQVSRRRRVVDTVDYSSSGGEQFQNSSGKKVHASLRARTWENFGRKSEKSNAKSWLLTTPEQLDAVPLRKMSQAALYREYKVKKKAG